MVELFSRGGVWRREGGCGGGREGVLSPFMMGTLVIVM